MQYELTRKAVELNDGQCFTYICAFCKEKKNFVNKRNTLML